MPLARTNNVNCFVGVLRFFTLRFCFFILVAVTFQSSAQTLKQDLNDLPIIDVDIASMDFPPNAHRTKNGRVSGKAIETIREFCRVARMKCEVIIYPTTRAYLRIENNSSDVLLTADLPALKRCCVYTQWSYAFIAGLITEKVDDVPVKETMLVGQRLVMVRGWQSIYAAYPNLTALVAAGEVELIETSSISSAIKIYGSGRASLLWGANLFEWYFEKLSIPWEEKNFKPLVVNSAGIWVAKQSEHNEEILNRFNLAYQLLREQGKLDANNFLIPSLMKQVYVEAAMP